MIFKNSFSILTSSNFSKIIFFIKSFSFLMILISAFIFSACSEDFTPEEKAYIEKIKQFREAKNREMENSPESPFNFKGKVKFHDLEYFSVDPKFVFKSKLYEFEHKDTVIVYGTKADERKTVKYGFVQFDVDQKPYRINVYKGFAKNGNEYYSIWFTDQTTNIETYGVGRYLDFEKHPDKDYVYTIDFNLAYNPYCAYSPDYSCAIPTKEDFIDLAINAGEKKFHE